MKIYRRGELEEQVKAQYDAGVIHPSAIAKALKRPDTLISRTMKRLGLNGTHTESATPSLELPALDPDKPLGPQCESVAVALLMDAAKTGSKAQKIQASKELLRIAERDKQPRPISRVFKFILETIDIGENNEYNIKNAKIYEIKP